MSKQLDDDDLIWVAIDEHTDDVVDARLRFNKNHNLHAYQVRLKQANSKLYEAIKLDRELQSLEREK